MTETDDQSQEAYYCAGCIKDRGYRLPFDGVCGHLTTKCSACDKYEVCFLVEDLVPIWDPDH